MFELFKLKDFEKMIEMVDEVCIQEKLFVDLEEIKKEINEILDFLKDGPKKVKGIKERSRIISEKFYRFFLEMRKEESFNIINQLFEYEIT